MTGKRAALVLATTRHEDPVLQRLESPAVDALEFGSILQDPELGGFTTDILLNASSATVSERIEDFFLAERKPNDLLLLYLSGHGIKDSSGRLYFATTNTNTFRLRSTAIAAGFLNDVLSESRSRRQIVLLDCCYAGAFVGNTKGLDSAGSLEALGGRGRCVITATDSLQYAFQGETLEGSALPSVFTSALIEGIKTGAADIDGDGLVSVDELYDYAYERMSRDRHDQRPTKTVVSGEGEIFIARAPGARVREGTGSWMAPTQENRRSTRIPHETISKDTAQSAERTPEPVVEPHDSSGQVLSPHVGTTVADRKLLGGTILLILAGILLLALPFAQAWDYFGGYSGPLAQVIGLFVAGYGFVVLTRPEHPLHPQISRTLAIALGLAALLAATRYSFVSFSFYTGIPAILIGLGGSLLVYRTAR